MRIAERVRTPAAVPVRRRSSARSPSARPPASTSSASASATPTCRRRRTSSRRSPRAPPTRRRTSTRATRASSASARPWPGSTRRASASRSTRPTRSSRCSAPRRASPTSAWCCSTRATSPWPPTPATRCTSPAPCWPTAPRSPLPLVPELGFQPDLEAIPAETARRAKMIFVSYPNNPTGAVIEDDFFARLVAFAQANDIVVVHDNAYADITYDGYVAPSFLATPGATEVGVEMFSLSKSYNMTGWRAGAIVGNREVVDAYWRLKTNMDSGMFGAVQRAAAAALSGSAGVRARDVPRLPAPARPAGRGAAHDRHARRRRPRAPSTCGCRCPTATRRPASPQQVLEQADVVVTPGAAYGAVRRGLRPPLADRAGRAPRRGRAAHRGAGTPLTRQRAAAETP